MSLELDFLTNMVNVHWESGLAVEFSPTDTSTAGEAEPSYIHLATGIPNFSKAVISLWFRVPHQSVIEAAANSLQTEVPNFFVMQGILPLVTFGQLQQNLNYTAVFINVGQDLTNTNPNFVAIAPSYVQNSPYTVEPCYIGLQCHSDGTFDLVFNIQTGVYGTWENLQWAATAVELHPNADVPIPDVVGNGWIGNTTSTIEDVSFHIRDAQPENFYVLTDDLELKPDTWHHLLLSFDVGKRCSIGNPYGTTECKMWYAIDDNNYRGARNLQPYRDAIPGVDEEEDTSGDVSAEDGLGPNDILTRTAYDESGKFPDKLYFLDWPVLPPAGDYNADGAALIPTVGHELGIPASSAFLAAIFGVQMAEFQMWIDETLDTAEQSNRRAFVDDEGNPAKPELAEALLGKRPEILLHGTKDWQSGMNTGSLGTDDGGVTIPSGQFEPVGQIDPFKPDPSLQPQPEEDPEVPAPLRLTRHARL